MQRQRIINSLICGYDVIADNTNVNTKFRKDFYDIVDNFNDRYGAGSCGIHVILFKNTQEAFERNKARTGTISGDMEVPIEVMDKMCTSLVETLGTIEQEPWNSLTMVDSFQTRA